MLNMILQILTDIRNELKRLNLRVDAEFSEVRNRFQKLDEKLDAPSRPQPLGEILGATENIGSSTD